MALRPGIQRLPNAGLFDAGCFSLDDTAITAIVTQPTEAAATFQQPIGSWAVQKTGLPDGSPGLFG